MFLGHDVHADFDSLIVAVAGDLNRQGVATRLTPAFEGAMLFAGRGPCRMAIRAIRPSGAIDDLSRHEFAQLPRRRFAYRGELLPKSPKLRPYVSYELARAANRLGIPAGWDSVLMIADNGRCGPTDLPSGQRETRFRPLA